MIKTFIDAAKQAHAHVLDIHQLANVPASLFNILKSHDLPLTIRISEETVCQQLKFDSVPTLKILNGRANTHDAVSLTGSICGIAETGSIVMQSSRTTSAALFFLPLIHIVLLAREDIVQDDLSAWQKCNPSVSRTIHFITGPSRTADIEQTLYLGMHGPKYLYILLYDKEKKYDQNHGF